MTRPLLLVLASLIAICLPLAAHASTDCAGFVSRLHPDPDSTATVFDIATTYSIESGIVSGAYVSIQPLESGCTPGDLQTAPATAIGLPPHTAPYKDVAAGVHQGTPWIQFVHPSTNEYGPGLSSSVVVYDADGRSRSSRIVSSYHSWEGAQTLASTLSNGRLVRCEQTIEFFSYSDSGDIDGELPEPLRSACETSVMPFP